MKLAVSNIAWYNNRIDDFIHLISGLGCSGIELAPSMIWSEPVETTPHMRKELSNSIIDAKLKLTGLQSLLYTRQELVLFGDEKCRQKMLIYLTDLMDLCHDLGGDVLVFGSPRNRNIGNLPSRKARVIALDFFRELGKRAGKRNVYFCIEPLSRNETDFINTVAEAQQFIEDAGKPDGLGLHIDTKDLIEEGEVTSPYLEESFAHAIHVHISETNLMCPGTMGFDHSYIGKRIRASGYTRFGSIEMRRVDGDVKGAIVRAVEYVKEKYF